MAYKKKMIRRQRNHAAKLPFDARLRLFTLLMDNVEYESIRKDSVIAEACRGCGIKRLHSTSIAAWEQSEEFAEFKKEFIRRKFDGLFIHDPNRSQDRLEQLAGILCHALEKMGVPSSESNSIPHTAPLKRKGRCNKSLLDTEVKRNNGMKK